MLVIFTRKASFYFLNFRFVKGNFHFSTCASRVVCGWCASPPVSISLPSSPLVSPFSTSSSTTSRPAPLLCLLFSSSVDCSKHRTSNYSGPSPIPRVSSSLHTLPIAVFGRRTSSPPSTKKIKSELVVIEHGEKET